MNNNDPIITALQDQVTCYQRLAKLAEIQHEHVQKSQTDQLLDVLSKRQQVLEEVADLEQLIGPAKQRWSDYLSALGPDQRNGAARLLAETRRLLEQITTADRNDAIVLQQRKLNLGRQIGKATAAKVLNRNYAAAAYGTRPSTMDIQL
jgi:hypothetical protein